jgi:hypothetical protein
MFRSQQEISENRKLQVRVPQYPTSAVSLSTKITLAFCSILELPSWFQNSKLWLARARAARELVSLPHLQFQQGDAECLPLADDSIDVVMVNGIFNLNPKRKELFLSLRACSVPMGAPMSPSCWF